APCALVLWPLYRNVGEGEVVRRDSLTGALASFNNQQVIPPNTLSVAHLRFKALSVRHERSNSKQCRTAQSRQGRPEHDPRRAQGVHRRGHLPWPCPCPLAYSS